MGTKSPSEFEKAALDEVGGNIVSEFWYFLKCNKKWWLLPIVMVLLLLGALILTSSSAAAPFIYVFF